MIKREHVEAILKVNGVEPSSPDEVIRSVLLSARYDEDEVDAAIMVLRENKKTKKTRVDGLHKVFRTDETLQPEEISSLLGIDVDLTERIEVQSKSRDLGTLQQIIVWALSIILAVGGILYLMHTHQVGIFHPTTGLELSQ